MTKSLLSVVNLQVSIEGKRVIDSLDLEVGYGEVVVIMGPNGGGKSSLAMTLMGNPNYKIPENQKTKASKIEFEGRDLLKMSSDERARSGLYSAWQNPVTIPGVTVFSLCKALRQSSPTGTSQGKPAKITNLVEFKEYLEELALKVGLTKEHVSRDVNSGFSGGERKRLELLQLLLSQPKLAIIDEIDSGLDAEGIEMVVQIVSEMKQKKTSFVLITHNKRLLDKVLADKVYQMKYGRLSAGV